MKEGIFALVTAVAVAFTAIPKGAAAISDKGGEYLERVATGTLYVPYTAADKPISREESPQPEAPPFYKEEGSAEEESAEENSESVGEERPVPDNAIAVQAVNLSRLEPTDPPALLMSNETDYSVDLASVASKPQHLGGGAVLIIHTHGTEAYLAEGAEYYFEDEDFRSTNRAENVVAVGAEFAQALESKGIQVYHDQTMYDEHSYNNAYTASRSACREWLETHPEISYIIDIHRDAVTDAQGINQKPLCKVEGQSVAQVMLVIGTDAAGANHGGWQTNLGVGAKYQGYLTEYPSFARPIYLRRASYNQQLCRGSMLLEVGGTANTLTEAKAAARFAAEAFSRLYTELQ